MTSTLLIIGPTPGDVERVRTGLERLGFGATGEGTDTLTRLNRLLLRLFGQSPESSPPLDYSSLPPALAEWFSDQVRVPVEGDGDSARILTSTEMAVTLPFWLEAFDSATGLLVFREAHRLNPGAESEAGGPAGGARAGRGVCAPLTLDPAEPESVLRKRLDELERRLRNGSANGRRRLLEAEQVRDFAGLLHGGSSEPTKAPTSAGCLASYALLVRGAAGRVLESGGMKDGGSADLTPFRFDWNRGAEEARRPEAESNGFAEAFGIALEERDAQMEFLRNEVRRQAGLMTSRAKGVGRLRQREKQLESQLQLERNWRRDLQRTPLFRAITRLLGRKDLLKDPRVEVAADPDQAQVPVISRRSKSRDTSKQSSGLEALRQGVWMKPWPWPDRDEDLLLAPSPREVDIWFKVCQELRRQPLISVIIPVHRISPELFRSSLQSVFDQVYSHWEICVALDDAVEAGARQVLDDFLKEFPGRIKLAEVEGSPGIAVSTNQAAALAEGEYLAFLDHDDRLTPDALLMIAQYIEAHPEAELIYTDEDCIDPSGAPGRVLRKPDFSPELLLSCNYIIHLVTVSKSLFERVGQLREGYEFSQDYDLVLRASEAAAHIGHIPQVLYHWRMHEGSTTHDPLNRTQEWREASRKALQDAAERRGWRAVVGAGAEGDSYRVRFAVDDSARVSVIIPTHNNLLALRACLRSLTKRTRYRNFEIVIVSNRTSCPRTLEFLSRGESEGRFRVLKHDIPFNYSALNNFAVQHCDSPYLLLLNDDTEVIDPEWMEAMLEHAQRPEIGAVGAQLLFPSGTIQHAGIFLGGKLEPGHAFRNLPSDYAGPFGMNINVRNALAVTAACLMVRRSAYLEVGGLDETLAVTFNDVDFCLKLGRAGYRNVYTPYARLLHYESVSRGIDESPEKRERMFEELNLLRSRWESVIPRDPYFVPGLDTGFGDAETS